MPQLPEQETDTQDDTAMDKPRNLLRKIAAIALVILLVVVGYTWTVREQIARDLIAEQLAGIGVPATYDVTEISPERQVLTNIVVGDPARPDLTIERAEITLSYGLGVPEIGRITLVRPRLYGSYTDGELSLGSLDPVIFAESEEPTGLPAWDIDLIDGRALFETDFGPVGVKAEGQGQLDNGFTGMIAAIAPQADIAGCRVARATVYGDLTTTSGRLTLSGPVRTAALNCPEYSGRIKDVSIATDITFDADMAGFDADASIAAGAFAGPGIAAAGIAGPLTVAVRDGTINSRFNLAARSVANSNVRAGEFSLEGGLRGRDQFASLDLDAELSGSQINIGRGFTATLAEYEKSAEGTLAAPLLAKIRSALGRKLVDSSFTAAINARKTGDIISLSLPQGSVQGRYGETLLSVSQVQIASTAERTPRMSGNFRFGGGELPALVGRMEQANGRSIFRLKMAEYSAQGSSLAIPELVATQDRSGALGFSGSVQATGPLPGGEVRGLRLPVSGSWSSAGGLSLWRGCTQIGFDTLAFANLELRGQQIALCPASGRPIVSYGTNGLNFAAGAPSLNIAGTLAGTEIRISSGAAGFAYPGAASVKDLLVSLGPQQEENRFAISELKAVLGEDITGSFSGAEIALFAVPLDLKDTTGEWSYAGGVFEIGGASFELVDRSEEPRFNPLMARDAKLSLEDSVILADALLRYPGNESEVAEVSIQHDLTTSTGFADLHVPGVLFDEELQPVDLTPLALGVIANARGSIAGTGRIDWNSDAVTSSGRFSSESLDFAAAFGPVTGAAGTVEFIDLLSLTTAPDQKVRVAAINPGIEVNDGVIGFSLRDGQYLGVTGGEWPFMGGTLTLRPVDLNFGVAERRRYVLEVDGLEAALFVENLELGNLAATGTFDGQLPLEFDELGFGEIKGGLLVARAPGGNISYVGELTYEDLSAFANYAFETLKSLDYDDMRIEMDGPLTGDIVTRIRFDGVRQGAGTKQNFITRQIADLPIRFNVNIRAPFYKLVTTLKSIYDPSTVRDPRELGLLEDDGKRFIPAGAPLQPAEPVLPPPINPVLQDRAIKPDDISDNALGDEEPIQTSDSEDVP
ncbi:intermembrane phospholipid transport protein YdbH family protein [Pontixanthobacter luteolus]|nr:YdbH domain-containing protein [Pontixanthobacter luteolus]